MTLNASGPLSMGGSTTGQSINLELGVSATALASINSSSFRTLAGVASGQISLSNFYGKSNTPPYFISGGTSYYSAFRAMKFTASGKTIVASRNTAGTGTSPYVSGAMYVTSLSSTGAENWTMATGNAEYGSSGQFVQGDVNEDSSGNVYHSFYSAAQGAVLLFKFNSSGTLTYQKQVGITGVTVQFWWVTVDGSGNTYVQWSTASGTLGLYKIDNTGTVSWNYQFTATNSQSVQRYPGNTRPFIDSSGNIYVAYSTQDSSSGGYYRTNVIKLNSSGTVLANSAIFPTSTTANVLLYGGPVVNSSGEIFLCLYIAGVGYSLVKLNSSCVLQWAYTNASGNGEGYIAVTLGQSDSVIATSSTTNAGGYPSVIYTNINASSGAIQWTRQLSHTANVPTQPLVPYGDGASSMGFFPNEVGSFQAGGIRLPLDGSYGAYQIPGQTFLSLGANYTLSFQYQILTGLFTTQTQTATTSSFTSTAIAGLTRSTTYANTTATPTFTLTSAPLGMTPTAITGLTNGSQTYSIAGTYSWLCPTGVSSVSVLCIGGGGGGVAFYGGGGGASAYGNNMPVTAGVSYTVNVGGPGAGSTVPSSATAGGTSTFSNSAGLTLSAPGGASATDSAGGAPGNGSKTGTFPSGSGTGSGGQGNVGGGGGPAYDSTGGAGGNSSSNGSPPVGGGGGAGGFGATLTFCGCCAESMPSSGGGGGLGLMGIGVGGAGSNGYNNNGGSGGAGVYFNTRGGNFGGGGGAGGYTVVYSTGKTLRGTGGRGGTGVVRIVWPGNTRLYPTAGTTGSF